jgi:hypothetical protein
VDALREERMKEDEILYPPKQHHLVNCLYIYIRGNFTEDL